MDIAKVISIVHKTTGAKLKCTVGLHDNTFEYVVGKTVKPDSYDPSPLNECSHGIRFFITKDEAMRWNG